jgi:hypothetical protein
MADWLRKASLASAAVVIAAVAAVAALPPAHAADAVELRWNQLIPQPRERVAARDAIMKVLAPAKMTQRVSVNMASPSGLVHEFNGQRVTISGMVVALEGERHSLKKFLLFPFAGACVQFPPPRNQLILVVRDEGVALADFFDPVAVTGVIHALPAQTRLGHAGYRIVADTVAPRQ